MEDIGFIEIREDVEPREEDGPASSGGYKDEWSKETLWAGALADRYWSIEELP